MRYLTGILNEINKSQQYFRRLKIVEAHIKKMKQSLNKITLNYRKNLY